MNNTLYRFTEKRTDMGKPTKRIGGNRRKAELRYNTFIYQANSLSRLVRIRDREANRILLSVAFGA